MTKIEALEKTISNLKNGVYQYRWYDVDQCNCGVVARTLLGNRTAKQGGLLAGMDGCGFSGIFKNTVERCEVTGIPMPEVFEALKSAGFTYDELYNLELLKDKTILEKAGFCFHADYEKKEHLIKYLTAWVEILKEKELIRAKEAKPERVKTVYVSVPETIKDQTGELILS